MKLALLLLVFALAGVASSTRVTSRRFGSSLGLMLGEGAAEPTAQDPSALPVLDDNLPLMDPLAPAPGQPPLQGQGQQLQPLALSPSSQAPLSNEQAVAHYLQQASALLQRMEGTIEQQTAWARNVHEVIQSYQFKYTKVLEDIKLRKSRAVKLKELVTLLKAAQLHSIIESDLRRATEELGNLGEGSEGEGAEAYAALQEKVAALKAELGKLSKNTISGVLENIEQKIREAAADAIPPPSSDALAALGGDVPAGSFL